MATARLPDGVAFNWRASYYGLLALMGLVAVLSGYSPHYLTFIYSAAALTALILFLARALLWLAAERPSDRWRMSRITSVNLIAYARSHSAVLLIHLVLRLAAAAESDDSRSCRLLRRPNSRVAGPLHLGPRRFAVAHEHSPFMTASVDLLYSLWPASIMGCALGIAVFPGAIRLRRFFLSWALCF